MVKVDVRSLLRNSSRHKHLELVFFNLLDIRDVNLKGIVGAKKRLELSG